MVDRRERRDAPRDGRVARLLPARDRLRPRSDRRGRSGVARPPAPVRRQRRGSARDAGRAAQRHRATPRGGRTLAADRRRRRPDAARERVRARDEAPAGRARRGARRRPHHRLPDPLSAVRRSARPGAAVASRLPGELHDRIAPARGRRPGVAGRALAGAAGDRAPRPPRLHGRHAARGAVQRPPVRPFGGAARGHVRARRSGRARRPAGGDDPAGSGPARAHHLRGPRRRAARRRLREGPRLRAVRRGRRDHAAAVRPAQGQRDLLYAAIDDGVPRPADARAARPRPRARRHPVASRRGSGDGQRRVPGRRVPLSRGRLRRRADRRRDRGPRGHHAGGSRRPSAARSRSAASTASI